MKPKEAEQSFEELKKDLRSGALKQMYLLFGEERFLKKFYFDKLVKAFGGEPGDMNTNSYEGKGVSVEQIIDQAETLPFLAERRVMLLRDTGLLKSGGDALAEYLENPCESTVFLFFETDVDGRNKLYKTIAEKGRVVEIIPQKREYLKTNIGAFLKKENKIISMAAAESLLDKTGSDMATLYSEMEKLVSYCLNKDEISLEDVETICSETIEDKVFDMLDLILTGNAPKAMELYYDLLALKEPPIKILTLLERQVSTLLQIRQLRDAGEVRDNIVKKVGVRPFLANSYMNQAARHSREQLERYLRTAVETDEAIKTGRISDVLGVETLILEMLPPRS